MPRASPQPDDARTGLAFGLIKFGLIFIVGILLWIVLDPAFQDIMAAQSAHTDSQAASTGANWISQAWTWAPFWISMLAFIMLLARAFTERQVGGIR